METDLDCTRRKALARSALIGHALQGHPNRLRELELEEQDRRS